MEEAINKTPSVGKVGYKDDSALRKAVEDAETLLEYASSKGVGLAPDIVKTLVSSKTLLADDVNSPTTFEQQANFWNAREKLAEAVQPVTIASLKAAHQTTGRTGLIGGYLDSLFGEKRYSRADRVVYQFRLRAFWALLLLLVVHVYWAVGSHLILNTQTLLDQVQQSTQPPAPPAAASAAVGTAPAAVQTPSKATPEQEKNMIFQHSILHQWNTIWRQPFVFLRLTTPIDPQDVEHNGIYQSLKSALLVTSFACKGLEHTILPMLYGFLGACLYVLRCLANDIRLLAYLPEHNTLYRLRIYMGTLAGLIITWFALPDAQPKPATLTPFALAFLAGYSVELLFSLLDKIIATFSNK